MDRIQLLEDSLINKIAAGEVVERPSSVVKELVENALDAGATKITVDVQEGGRKRIVVSDNGCGMSPGDATRSLLRHATSKIKTSEDLFNLNTMGFRGEALASISSVCRFTLMTCEQGASNGVRLQASGDGPIVSTPWQSAGGTTIICDDLFFNVPVRQKFLKSAAAEYGVILELTQALALAHPQIDFTLIHNGKETLRAPSVLTSKSSEEAIRARFAQVMKGDGGLGMIFTEAQSQWASMVALVSAPGVERASAKDMFLFVNGRWIKDKSLRFAVLRGYHSHLLRGRYPVVAVFLTVDAGLVDVNVHPAKTEVRLQYANEIHGMVANAVRDGIRRGEWAAAPSHPVFAPAKNIQQEAQDDFFPTKTDRATDGSRARPAAVWRDVTPKAFPNRAYRGVESLDSSPRVSQAVDVQEITSGEIVGKTIDSIPWAELNYLGSVADCYLLFGHGDRASGSRLLAVDQHAFHERVLYERLLRNHDLLKSSQPLLVPECVQLSPKAIATLTELKPKLQDNGFRFDVLDDSAIEVLAVPVLLAKSDVATLFERIADHGASGPLDDNVGIAHDILATIACHSAVRAGEQLGADELKILINEASDVDFYHNCPHGRRVFRWWDEAQIARWFDR